MSKNSHKNNLKYTTNALLNAQPQEQLHNCRHIAQAYFSNAIVMPREGKKKK